MEKISKIVIVATIAIWAAVAAVPDSRIHITVCDVGQGDGILVTQGTKQLLIDTGPNDKIIGCLGRHMPFWDRKIEVIVITHNQADHNGGLEKVKGRYEVEQLIQGTVIAGDVIRMGKISYEIEGPSKVLGATMESVTDNEQGVIGRVCYGKFCMGLTADVSSANMASAEEMEVLKVPHHGSKTGLDKEWLAQTRAKLAVISVGKGNRYGHPAPETIKLLQELGMKILRTDESGDVEIISDGEKWWVKEGKK